MGKKEGLPSSSEFIKLRAAEDKKIVEKNKLLINQIEKRVDYNLKDMLEHGDGGQKVPINLQQSFNDVTARKKDGEFINKGRYAYRCSLNAFNNALPSGIVVTTKMMMLLRDMKALQLAKSHMGLYERGQSEQVIISLLILVLIMLLSLCLFPSLQKV